MGALGPAMVEESGIGFFRWKTFRESRIFDARAMPYNSCFLLKENRHLEVDKNPRTPAPKSRIKVLPQIRNNTLKLTFRAITFLES